MKTAKSIFYFLLLLLNLQTFAQNRKVADRYFNEFAYIKAAKMYESLYKKGDDSEYILKRLGDSYYNNAETQKAEFWFDKLVAKNAKTEDDYLFKYAQVLRSNGNYKKSDSLLLIITPNTGVKSKKEELEDQNYLLNLENSKQRISIRNIALNTEFSDFGGFIINDNETYFASAAPKSLKKEKIYKWNNQPFLNIYRANNYITSLEDSRKDTILELEYKKLLPATVNTQYHESTPVFTKDLKTMYFTRVNFDGKKLRKDKKETINLKIYKADYSQGKWTNIKELPFNNDEYSVGHPALSPDGKTLYFVSDMPGGIGKTDIYKVDITEEGYSTPLNLGETINTFDKEMFPFVGEDNILYFSSNGHIGLGLLDVFQSKIKENNMYDKPVNLGHPFNSKKDDFSFFIDKKGKKGFVSSNREKGKGDDDIYSFIIYDEVKPKKCIQTIEGIVRSNHDNSPIPYTLVKLVTVNGEVISEVYSKEDGSYSFNDILCTTKSYNLNGSKQDFKPDTKNVVAKGINGSTTKVDLLLTPLIIGDQIIISPIYFDFNKSIIREDAEYELENIVTVMNNHSDMVIKIESHTDSRGAKEYNRSLSDRRAKSTRDYLISRGISNDRIENAIGYGEEKLLNNCNDANKNKCTEEEHQLNRRSYFYIVKGGQDVDILNKKPTKIDNSLLIQKKKILKNRVLLEKLDDSLLIQKNKILKNKILLEKLDNFKKGRSRKKTFDKCKQDTDCN